MPLVCTVGGHHERSICSKPHRIYPSRKCMDSPLILCFYEQQKGQYVVRMEDIDIQRSKRELGESLLDDLEWLGFEWDEGPRVGGPESTYWQSERQTYYGDVLEHFASEKTNLSLLL